MIDREKVIKGLNCCCHADGANCIYCPYDIADSDCTALMSMDVLAMLKEHDSVAPLTIDDAVSEIMDKHYKRLKEKEAVVRCNDCRYGYCINQSYDEKEKIYECMKYPIANLRITHKPDWFCADGERRETE